MRTMTAAFALATAVVLCNVGTFSGVAHARTWNAVVFAVRVPDRSRLRKMRYVDAARKRVDMRMLAPFSFE